MPINGHTTSSHTLFAPRQNGQPILSRTPVTADATPSAVRPGGLPAARALTQSASSLPDESSVDGERPALRGWQDKGALGSAPQASPQPASVTESARRSGVDTGSVRSRISTDDLKRSARMTLRVRPGVKTALERIAHDDKVSLSEASATGLEVYARAKIHDQEETLFEPRMQAMLRREIRASDNRHIYFEMRNAIAAEQTRILTTDLYKRQLQKEGVSLKEIEEKLDKAYNIARTNVLRKTKTPQLKTLLDAWWRATEEGDSKDGEAGMGKSED